MKPYFATLLIVFSICSRVEGQDTTSFFQNYTAFRLAVGPSVIAYYPFSYLPAIERRMGNYSIQLQAGLVIPTKYNIRDTLDNMQVTGTEQWYTIRAEARKFKPLRNNFIPGKREVYIGVELFANYNKTPRFDEYYSKTADEVYEDALVLTKKMAGISIVLGKQRYIGKHFLVGTHLGLGIKFKYTTTTNNRYYDGRTTYTHGTFIAFADQPGFTTAFAMPININVAYIIR